MKIRYGISWSTAYESRVNEEVKWAKELPAPVHIDINAEEVELLGSENNGRRGQNPKDT